MNLRDTDADWEVFAKLNPYTAVLSHEKYNNPNPDQKTIQEFFETGEKYISWVFDTARRRLDYEGVPQRALDFGCGVGRLVFPLARRASSAMGVDISESMLAEAKKHCDVLGLKNVILLKSDDNLSRLTGEFDFVHTYVVLQHIPCHRGLRLIERMVELLADGGFGVLQLTYSKARYQNIREENWPSLEPTDSELFQTLVRRVSSKLKGLLRIPRKTVGKLLNRLIKNRRKEPDIWGEMQMNTYALNPIFHLLQVAGVRRFHAEFTDHGGQFGVVLFFRKQPGSSYDGVV